MRRHSPCVGICKLDDTTGYCLGCGRSGDEVAQWVVMSEAQRDDVWLKLPARLEILGVRLRLLRWTAEELLIWIAETIVGRRGTWMIGAFDAVAKFACTAEREIDIKNVGDAIIARSPEAAFRLRINGKVRAFAIAENGPIVLGLPNGRAAMPLSAALTALGPDCERLTSGVGTIAFSTSAWGTRAAAFAFGPMTRGSQKSFRLIPDVIGRKSSLSLAISSSCCAQPASLRRRWHGLKCLRRSLYPLATRLERLCTSCPDS